MHHFAVTLSWNCGCSVLFLIDAGDPSEALSVAHSGVPEVVEDLDHYRQPDGLLRPPDVMTVALLSEDAYRDFDLSGVAAVVKHATQVQRGTATPMGRVESIPPGLADLQAKWENARWN